MISFPNAKINLGLQILGKRADGYHEIETCIYPIPLCDVIEIVPSNIFSFQSSGLPISGDQKDNLVVKAYELLKSDYSLPPVAIYLHKSIPMGAGLGGGSSDAANMLKSINELFNLQLDNTRLLEYAGELGSDCPFFIENIPVIATGTGTDLQPIDLNLNKYHIELAHPDVHISTSEAYGLISPSKRATSLIEVIERPVNDWTGNLMNDFEIPIISKYPEIQTAKDEFHKKGAIYTSMTGSGSTVFGIFDIN